MPRSQGTAVVNNFSAGFITEATGLNFPPNSCTETYNCVHEQVGNITRRLGIDFETNYALRTIDRNNDVIATYLWKNVAGSATTQIVVMQVGSVLLFYDGSTTDPLSAHPLSDFVNLDSFLPAGFESPRSQECQFADGNGILFVTHPLLNPFYVQYDANTEEFTATEITLRIRDLK